MTPQELLARLDTIRETTHPKWKWSARCPAHEDNSPSLSIGQGDDGAVLVKCWAGCTKEAIAAALGLTPGDFFLDPPGHGCVLEDLAAIKQLPLDFLRSLGLSQITLNKVPAVRIPFPGLDGTEQAVQHRLACTGQNKFRWKPGAKPCLYGLNRLGEARAAGRVVMVEGASDCWTLWHRGFPALGLPSASGWMESWASALDGIATVYVVVEPDQGGEAVKKWLAKASIRDRVRLVTMPDGCKDPSALHLQNPEQFPLRLQACLDAAVSWTATAQAETAARLAELRVQAAPVLAAEDPLVLVKEQTRSLGYGGDVGPAVTLYVAATTRLLRFHSGAMPSHVNVIGPPGLGKSWAVKIALRNMPKMAYHEIDASSPRVFIYEEEPYQHRAVIFGEADSLPSGEDNPAASAMRNLLQDGHVHYKAVVKNSGTGQFVVQTINKPGPTMLITTSIKYLPAQMDSRVFSLEVADDPAQLRAALDAQAQLELNGQPTADPALVAFQEYLQLQAPWCVVVPFAERLGKAIGEKHVAPRVVRDYVRLLALIKGVTILRHTHRQRDGAGRLVATLADYQAVYELVGSMYEAAASEASPKVRATVQAVRALLAAGTTPVSVTKLAKQLKVSVAAASGRYRSAVKRGFLVNEEKRPGYPAILKLGEDLPDPCGLPKAEHLERDEPASQAADPSGLGDEPLPEPGPTAEADPEWPEAFTMHADPAGAGGNGNGTSRSRADDPAVPDAELSDAEFCYRHGCSLADLYP